MKSFLDDVKTVKELTEHFHKYLEFLYAHNFDLIEPKDFINRFILYSCDIRYKELLIDFLSQYYPANEIESFINEISFYSKTYTNKYLSNFKVGRDKYYAIVNEYILSTKEFNSERYELTLYYLKDKNRYTYIKEETNFSLKECVRHIRNSVGSWKNYDITWLSASMK
ncbi:hypothetical protein SAMN04487895_10382 [Paenibacillus sophorae]|uniref:Uncharacterized protein n=1 Tax=Paenibacillus sophorae TaxID=1333845 RepID=A0A1H8JMD9_9BACL|nr:hypothetical protein [Paenibacillus sophorae]QWU13418.1 hypothetical protein KP014_15570 [Paenibacillus sophorae]SEN81924.1 hypothetical protein SAMN04487895_10382 [Paenibacillus sophorae]